MIDFKKQQFNNLSKAICQTLLLSMIKIFIVKL